MHCARVNNRHNTCPMRKLQSKEAKAVSDAYKKTHKHEKMFNENYLFQ